MFTNDPPISFYFTLTLKLHSQTKIGEDTQYSSAILKCLIRSHLENELILSERMGDDHKSYVEGAGGWEGHGDPTFHSKKPDQLCNGSTRCRV